MHKERLHKFSACCAVCTIAMAWAGTGFNANAQTASPNLSFEVATVKPVIKDASHRSDPKHRGPHVSASGASYWYMTVEYLVDDAYGLEPDQVTGPAWTAADRFDVEAKFPEGADKNQDRQMLQALLNDRFKLAFHIEKKELEVYALVIGPHGEKLKPSLPDTEASASDSPSKAGDNNAEVNQSKTETSKSPDDSGTQEIRKHGTQTIKFNRETGAQHWELSKMDMEDLAARLSVCMDGDHRVVNETGIKGNYQVAYDCPVPRPQPLAGADTSSTLPSDPPGNYSLSRSLDALGLKLEKRKVMQDVSVIDHVDKPSEN